MLNLTKKKKGNLLEIFNLSEIAKTERKRKKHGSLQPSSNVAFSRI